MADEETKEETPTTPEEKPAKAEKAEKAEAAEKTAPATKDKEEKAPAAKDAEEKPAAKKDSKDDKESKEAKDGEKKKEKGAGDDVFLLIEGGEDEAAAGAPKVLKAKSSKNVHNGLVHVKATFNNTIVTVTDSRGNVIGWSSAGKMGFRGSRKSTAYAAQIVSSDACKQAMGHGLKEVEVRVKGPGSGRESAVRAVQSLGIDITRISDVTPVPHNGCRPPKPRRV